jgi:DNA mismatch endonuclease (patch repair protein)
MVDIVDPDTRSRMMAGIKGSVTKPEIQVRRYLHACGFRFRLHRKDLPGRPDLVLPRYRLTIFVHGCFWHRHAGCHYASTPSTRPDFWQEKFAANVDRDRRNIDQLLELGWRVFVLWECGLRHCFAALVELPAWIVNDEPHLEWPIEPARASCDRTITY